MSRTYNSSDVVKAVTIFSTVDAVSTFQLQVQCQLFKCLYNANTVVVRSRCQLSSFKGVTIVSTLDALTLSNFRILRYLPSIINRVSKYFLSLVVTTILVINITSNLFISNVILFNFFTSSSIPSIM